MRIGIDLGGSKTEGIALAPDGTELARARRPTDVRSYQTVLDGVQAVVAQLESETGQHGSVGVGTPGAVSLSTGRLKNSNTTALNGQPVLEDLSAALQREVRLANDANCFALSEAVDGAARDARTVFGVIIGTGTGGGIVVNKQLLAGCNAIAGEWGHNPLPWPRPGEQDPPCYCGRTGCIETFLSGPGMTRDHGQRTGQQLSPPQIADLAPQDPQAQETLDLYVDRLARALATVINVLDPDAIVLGGGMSNIPDLAVRVQELWSVYVFSDMVRTALGASRHGDSSGVRGAAWLWPAEESTLR
jgi:predicted NBD/HSP70 family sugar kinase